MSVQSTAHTLSANEAACVTGVPLKAVHRIIDAGLLGKTAKRRKEGRAVLSQALVGLKLAHETTEILTLEGRRRLVRRAIDDPDATSVREDAVSVDLRPMKSEVRRGLSSLEKAKRMIVVDEAVLGGAPCLKGTRIAAHDIAQLVANGEDVPAVLAAYPSLTEPQVLAAAVFAEAYPRRGRPRQQPAWRKEKLRRSKAVKLDTSARAL